MQRQWGGDSGGTGGRAEYGHASAGLPEIRRFWLLEKLGIVSKEAAKAKLPESVTRQQPATVNADGKVMTPSGGFPSWGYGFAGMYDSGGYIPRGQFGIVGENGPEIVNGPQM